jgi:hypothetical protein
MKYLVRLLRVVRGYRVKRNCRKLMKKAEELKETYRDLRN